MTVSLSPTGGALIITSEINYVSETITASSEDLPIVLWEWDISPPMVGNFTVNYDDTSLTVNYVSADGLFPFLVTYLDANDNEVTVTKWADVPTDVQDSPEIMAMLASLINNKVWNLTVTATDSASNSVTENYTLQVYANYTANRDTLVAMVDARRIV